MSAQRQVSLKDKLVCLLRNWLLGQMSTKKLAARADVSTRLVAKMSEQLQPECSRVTSKENSARWKFFLRWGGDRGSDGRGPGFLVMGGTGLDGGGD